MCVKPRHHVCWNVYGDMEISVEPKHHVRGSIYAELEADKNAIAPNFGGKQYLVAK